MSTTTTHAACPTYPGQWFHKSTGACSCGAAHSAWTPATHCGACGIPLTPANRLRQHAGGMSCSHGPHD